MLLKRDSNPGVDVLAKFATEFPHYSLNWLLTGEGEMKTELEEFDNSGVSLQSVRNEIRGDLKIILDGMTDNFEVLNEGVLRLLRGNEKIQKFIKDLDQAKIKQTSKDLSEFLKAHQ